MTRVTPLLFVLLVAVPAGAADDKPDTKRGDEMIDKYLANLTKEVSGRFLDGAKTRDDWEKKLPRLRREYLDMLGLWPLPEKTPLHATVTATLEHEGAVIEKLHYQSRPGLYVTANLYRPKNAKGKLPAILYVCGHSGKGRDGNKTAFQDHGLWFANNGYVCLIVDTLQLGEIPGIHHGTYREGRWWWQALGYTPAGVECWNGIRGIDYLCSRDDVDKDRIGVTGISGGGASTVWIAAADERVKVAVPVSGMSDLESYVTNKVINGHCDCMFLVNTYQWDWTTIAALIAPRPMLFANSDDDKIFPMDGNRRVIAKLRQVYKMYDKPDLVDEYISKGGHDDRADLRVAAFQWMNKHLKNDTAPVKYEAFKQLPGKELRAFPEEKDLPKNALNGKIDETFVKRAEVKLPEEGQFAEWKKGMMKELREKSFRTFPDRIPAAGLKFGTSSDGSDQVLYETQPSIDSVLTTSHGKRLADDEVRPLVILNPMERSSSIAKEGAKPFLGEGPRYFLYPRGVDRGTEWTTKSPPNYVERAHALLGLTVDNGRLWDVLAVLHDVDKPAKLKWRLIGRGQAGILAAYAALFEPSIKEVVIVDPPTSHRDGPIFLNVLRVLDIPEALGLLAPDVKLTLVGAKDKAFDRTAQLYKLAGAEGKFQRK
ncbi:MAG TPA: prolyl oligopeptidase family serine peptidase [Gemmataceae bacterium]|nr:prolyl oligopeptidase family serine peptidase [Gemmataceae bacterium]